MSHAVARLRAARIARSVKPFLARGSRSVRCDECRLAVTHCLCAWRPRIESTSAVCLLIGWSRVEVDAGLPALLSDPQWQPYLVFPGEYVAAERVVSEVQPAPGKRPLFVLLDATWSEARKMFRKSPYLDSLPVLSLQAEQLSRYKLRRSKRDDHFCTAEVAALCLELAGDQRAADGLNAYLDVFSQHYLAAKAPRAVPLDDPAHDRLREFL